MPYPCDQPRWLSYLLPHTHLVLSLDTLSLLHNYNQSIIHINQENYYGNR
jgi:hypothetical protein